jgi:hypothetical protein
MVRRKSNTGAMCYIIFAVNFQRVSVTVEGDDNYIVVAIRMRASARIARSRGTSDRSFRLMSQ